MKNENSELQRGKKGKRKERILQSFAIYSFLLYLKVLIKIFTTEIMLQVNTVRSLLGSASYKEAYWKAGFFLCLLLYDKLSLVFSSNQNL